MQLLLLVALLVDVIIIIIFIIVTIIITIVLLYVLYYYYYYVVVVVVRLLYGLMLRKGGKASKGGGVARKSLVLRFLGCCEGDELGEFINLLTTPFLSANKDGELAIIISHVYFTIRYFVGTQTTAFCSACIANLLI